ncbi:MAG: nucleotidyltransferase substrate binding protein [Spirochaetaceae bacterium]|nr:nucleotidyltransferase substrate binding protein [Spirochaetaceae bacterium]
MEQDIRWKQWFHSYTKALAVFTEAVELARSRPLSPLEKQGLVQSFEFTQELSWKVLKDFLEYQGAATGILGSKDAIPRGFAAGLISDGDTWMDMIASRNLASHTYNQETADEILQKCVESYAPQFQQLQKRLEAEL